MATPNLSIAKDEFLKLLPLVPIIVATINLLETTYYYNFFEINIIKYITPSEFFTLELRPVIVVSGFFLVTSPFMYAFREYYYSMISAIHFGGLFTKLKFFLSLLALCMFMNYVHPVYKSFQFDDSDKILVYAPPVTQAIAFFVVTLIIAKGILTVTDKFDYPVNVIYNIYFVFFSVLIAIQMTAGAYAGFAAKKRIHNRHLPGSFLKTDKDSISIDSSNYIIGSTNSYYFIRNVKENSNLIIPSSQVKYSKFFIKPE